MTSLGSTETTNEQPSVSEMVVQQVSQRPLLMIGAAAVAGFVFGQFERGRSRSGSGRSMYGFAAAAMDSMASAGSRPMSLHDFAHRHSGS